MSHVGGGRSSTVSTVDSVATACTCGERSSITPHPAISRMSTP